MSRPVRIALLASGDELLRGRVRDTNAAWMAARLTAEGFDVASIQVAGDHRRGLVSALRRACSGAEAVIATGGLGPTADDVMRDAAADLMGVDLVEHRGTLSALRRRWRERGLPMPESNRVQARVPRGAALLRNDAGTAPGLRFDHRDTTIYCLPGVPREMERMFEDVVLPSLRRKHRGQAVRTRRLTCFGMAESVLADRCADLMDRRRAVTVGTAVNLGVISVIVHGTGAAAAEVDGVHGELLERLGDHVVSTSGAGLAPTVVALASDAGATVAFAESCTAGMASSMLADVPGASEVLAGGVTAYADDAKRELLGVPQALLRRHGAVSGPVAEAMAAGARERFGATLAVSTTGIAGPGGGTALRPVGLVWFALAGPDGVHSVRRRWPGDRAFVRGISAHAALDLLRRALQGAAG